MSSYTSSKLDLTQCTSPSFSPASYINKYLSDVTNSDDDIKSKLQHLSLETNLEVQLLHTQITTLTSTGGEGRGAKDG